MTDGIDHLVLAVEDPDAAAALLEGALGLRATGGGRHDALGTFNRLVWLGDSYLELIGVFDRTLAAGSWIGRPVLRALERGGGLATWAVAVDELDRHLAWLPAEVDLSAPIDGERRWPDGRVVRWRLAHPADPSASQPFLIEHDETAAEWTADERRARASNTHPVGGRVRLASLEVADPNPAGAAAKVCASLATTAEPDGRRAVKVRIGAQAVRFVGRSNDDGVGVIVELITDASLRRRSMRIGDSELRLRGASSASAIARTRPV